MNRKALPLVRELCCKADEYGVLVERNDQGACFIDAGIRVPAGIEAGRLVTEICAGGLGKATISTKAFGNMKLPLISFSTNYPAISLLGAQLAGWKIKIGDFSAIGSGPARALALKPKSVFEKIGYKDESDVAVLVLETSEKPSEEAVAVISSSCRISPQNLFLILAPTSSLVGFTQISGRIAETGVHKLSELGFDPKLIVGAEGCAPILPVHSDTAKAMGRTNDAILYGGEVHLTVQCEDDNELVALAGQSVSSASEQYGRPFAEIFKEAGFDFYKIDPALFAPAIMVITSAITGKTFGAGKLNIEVLKRSAAP